MATSSGSNRLISEFGEELLEVDESVQGLMDSLNQKYITQGGRKFGQFATNQDTFPISKYIEEAKIISDDSDFYNLSKRILEHLVAKANATSATEGWVVMCLYKYNQNKTLAVAVVNEVTGTAIDKSFKVKPSVYIDLAKLRHAGRINLTQWHNDQKGYVSFISALRDSTYFKEFLGCDSTNSNVDESNKLITAINAYCESKELNYEQRKEITSKAYDFLNSAAKSKTSIRLEHLANLLAPESPDELREYLVSDEYKINDDFVPDGRTLKKLIELTTESVYWKIKVNREAFQNGAKYDVERKVLSFPVTDTNEQEQFSREVEGLNDNEQN
jgi:nucleoid-associated protein